MGPLELIAGGPPKTARVPGEIGRRSGKSERSYANSIHSTNSASANGRSLAATRISL